MSYTVGTVNTTANSNLVSVTVAEILDVVVTAQTPTVSVTAGDTQQEVRYRVTNTGNGPETFRLVMNSVIAGDKFDPIACHAVYLLRYGRAAGTFRPATPRTWSAATIRC